MRRTRRSRRSHRPASTSVGASLTAIVVATSLVACGSGDDDASSSAPADTTIPEVSLVPATQPTASVPDVALPDSIPTELGVTVLTPGTGPASVAGDTVYVNYVGVLSEDGTQFDDNYGTQPYPVTLGAGGVIAGWDQGLIGVSAGERLQLDIPNDLAYGDQPQGDVIKAGDALSFVVDVRAVIPATDPATGPTSADIPVSTDAVTEVQVEDLTTGSGAAIADGDTGAFNLLAARGDTGEILDSTWETGQVQTLTLAQGELLEGLVEGLTGMEVGGRRLITLPADETLGLDPPTNLVVIAELLGVL
ncbi:MAG: FKBP-type peptidyl-prolyl cis-trans isomerase [Ilumatobacteraceae bacterium]